MTKKILITGSTDGIGLEAAKAFAGNGHTVLLHGRSAEKIEKVKAAHAVLTNAPAYRADLSNFSEVAAMAQAVANDHDHLDVLINNAGVLKTPQTITDDGLDIRFVVNTLAPYLLTTRLLPLMKTNSRVLNVSSAAQAPVDMNAMIGKTTLTDGASYAQSKLAITMWSRQMAKSLPEGPVIIAVNPGSLLGTKMVKEGYGMAGKDIGIGSDILVRLALDAEFATSSGLYFDNDSGQFGPAHPDVSNPQKRQAVTNLAEKLVVKYE